MPAFVLAEITIRDPEVYKQYASKTPETLQKHGGEFVIRGQEVKVLEGKWEEDRLVLLKFESAEAAQKWYDSEDYQAVKGLRTKASNGRLLLVEV